MMRHRTLPKPSRWLGNEKQREELTGYLFILPTYIGFLVFVLGPMLYTVYLSFTYYDIFSPPEYVGLENFARLFDDPRLVTVLKNTFHFSVFAVLGNVGLGLILALMLNRKMPRLLKYVFRSAYFFPSLIGLVFVSLIWQFLYQRDVGIINYYLGLIGIDPIPWLSSMEWSLRSVIVLDVWKNVGFAMLLILAGLQNISGDYYDAAAVDGANRWEAFRHVTLPLLSPTLFFVVTMYMIGALKVFDSIVVLTNGGPVDSSRSVVMYIYEQGFQSYDMGYASAISLLLLLIIGVLTLAQFGLSRIWVHYD